jgi:hypothetical protein
MEGKTRRRREKRQKIKQTYSHVLSQYKCTDPVHLLFVRTMHCFTVSDGEIQSLCSFSFRSKNVLDQGRGGISFLGIPL